MKLFKRILPNLSIALSLALLVLVIVDIRNPMMGFLSSLQAQILISVSAIVAIITAVVLYADERRKNK